MSERGTAMNPAPWRAVVRLAVALTVLAGVVLSVEIETDLDELQVPEGAVACFSLRLSAPPPSPVTVTVSVAAGDADIAPATVVRFATVAGEFDAALLDTVTPLTVANFLGYVRRGAYDGTFVHRSVPGFIVQGGGYVLTAGEVGHIATDPPVPNEPFRSNARATLAMAKLDSAPDSATSEWFVNLADNNDAGDPMSLDNQNGGFTVFGRIMPDGMGVLDVIAALPRANIGQPFTHLPVTAWDGASPIAEHHLVWVNTVAVVAAPVLLFTPENWHAFQTVGLFAEEDVDVADGVASVHCSSSGMQLQTVIATEADKDILAIATDVTELTVPEGDSRTLRVRLTHQPSAETVLQAVRVAGDADLTTAPPGHLTFTPGNWDQFAELSISALEDDGDASDGTATIEIRRLSGPDPIPVPVRVTATEVDDDLVLTLAVSGAGCTAPDGHAVADPSDLIPLAIRAVADPGHVFDHWQGSAHAIVANPLAGETVVTVDADTTVTAHFAVDADCDGMSDAWENANGLDAGCPDGHADADGDGYTNCDEYERRTNPHRYLIQLTKGWNTVAIGRQPEDSSVAALFGNAVIGFAWAWQRAAFRPRDELAATTGYCVLIAEDVAVEMPAVPPPPGRPDPSYTIRLAAGWNLIAIGTKPRDNSIDAILGTHVRRPVLTLIDGRYQPATELLPLRSYWTYAPATAEVTVHLP